MIFVKQDEFKKLLEWALRPIKATLKEHTGILKEHTESLETLKSSVATIEDTVETLKSSVVTMETTINVYGDMYKINNDNAKKLEKRVETLEDKAGVESPPELTLAEVQ